MKQDWSGKPFDHVVIIMLTRCCYKLSSHCIIVDHMLLMLPEFVLLILPEDLFENVYYLVRYLSPQFALLINQIRTVLSKITQ